MPDTSKAADLIPPGEEGDNSTLAVERLRNFLRTHDIPADGRLPTERRFAEIFGIGRRAVRRALEALEAEGLISRRQGAGTFFGQAPAGLEPDPLSVTATDFVEIMEVRLRLEPQLAQLAAMRARPEHIARLHALAAKIAGSNDGDERELWDGMLHRLIAQAAGNRLFLALFDTVNRIRQDNAWRAIRERARNTGSMEEAAQHHQRIVDAIERHDPVSAGEAMREHLLMLQENLIRQTSLDGGRPEPSPIRETINGALV